MAGNGFARKQQWLGWDAVHEAICLIGFWSWPTPLGHHISSRYILILNFSQLIRLAVIASDLLLGEFLLTLTSGVSFSLAATWH